MNWKLSSLILYNLIGVLLLLLFFLPVTGELIHSIDVTVFKFLNSFLANGKNYQLFFAKLTRKWLDWSFDVVMLFFFIHYIFSQKNEKLLRLSHCLFTLLYFGLCVILVDRYLFRTLIPFEHLSPSLVIPDYISIKQSIPGIKVKEISDHCFPSNHSLTAFLFSLFMLIFKGKKAFLYTLPFAFILSFARLITGAHWLSDIVIGSFSIALIFTSWGFFTPLFPRFCQFSLSLFRKKAPVV